MGISVSLDVVLTKKRKMRFKELAARVGIEQNLSILKVVEQKQFDFLP